MTQCTHPAWSIGHVRFTPNLTDTGRHIQVSIWLSVKRWMITGRLCRYCLEYRRCTYVEPLSDLPQ